MMCAGVLLSSALFAQLDPAIMTKPLGESWPTYGGDYSNQRYSSLTQINQSNVKNLTLAWVSHITPGAPAPGARGAMGPAFGNPGVPTIVGGEGTADASAGGFGGATSVRASILEVDGIL